MIKMLYIYFLENQGVKIKCIFIRLIFHNTITNIFYSRDYQYQKNFVNMYTAKEK